MTSMKNRSYFDEYAKHSRKSHRIRKLIKSSPRFWFWIKFTCLSLFIVGMVLPTPASTTHLHETQEGGVAQGHAVIPVDARPPFHHMADFPSLVGEPDYEFVTTKPHSGDLLTVSIVNEVLWNQVPVGQVDRQWLPPINTRDNR